MNLRFDKTTKSAIQREVLPPILAGSKGELTKNQQRKNASKTGQENLLHGANEKQ